MLGSWTIRCRASGFVQAIICKALHIIAYRRAAAKYHPDHNQAGLEMMQLINAAYDTLKQAYADNKINHEHPAGDTPDYGDAFNAALNAVRGLGLDIELCGAWIFG